MFRNCFLNFFKICLLSFLFMVYQVVFFQTPPLKAEGRFEFLHLWLTESEQNALKTISEPLKAQGIEWLEHPVTKHFSGIKEELSKRLSLGIPPTGVFWLGGPELRELVETHSFRVIPNEVNGHFLDEKLLPEVYEVLSYEGGLTALPVGIHLQNHIIYNMDILNELGLSLPKTWEELLSMGPALKKRGYDVLSISDQDWMLSILFASLLVEYLTPEQFLTLVENKGDLEGLREPFEKTFDLFLRLRPYFNPNLSNLHWAETTKRVIEGKALAVVLGDFATPLLPKAGSFHCDLPPGNKFILWSVDVIALIDTKSKADEAGQTALIDLVFSKDHMANYIAKKGGIPVLKDARPKDQRQCMRGGLEKWNSPLYQRVYLDSVKWSRELSAIAKIAKRQLKNPSSSPEKCTELVFMSLKALR